MCGIAGYLLSPDASVDPEWAPRSLHLLKHRGPDSDGLFECTQSKIGLLHTRLAIQDLSASGNQPMISPDGKVVLVFNGEIYNFRELRRELQCLGFAFDGYSDTEVLMYSYIKLRNECTCRPDSVQVAEFLNRLNGIFSFAIWDADLNATLICRDASGVKPLYFQANSSGFYFASELKALQPSSYSLDCSAVQRYLTFLWCPGVDTPFEEVKKMAPGQALWVSKGSIDEQFLWYVPPVSSRVSSPPIRSVKSELIGATRQSLRRAVHRQLIADVPVGSFLSGGLDSSAVVCFARELNPDIRCFTIDSGESNDPDLNYARRVADHLNVQLDVVRVDSEGLARGLEEMVWQLDEPLADPASLNVFYISQLAREQGIKVLLSGLGGDDLFSGYRRHLALYYERYWAWLPRKFRVQLRELTAHLPVSLPFARRLSKTFSGAHLDGDARLVHYFRWIARSDLYSLYTPAFRFSLGGLQAEDTMLSFLAKLPDNSSPLERMLALEQRFFLADHNLVYTDKMSMALGVEVRVPFLDSDLVEFAGSIPYKFKQRGRHGKWILKKAMESYLPDDVIYRPKSGFSLPVRRWLRFELRDWLASILSKERLHSRGLFDPKAVQLLIDANAEGKIDASYTLLSLACIEIWCSRFIDSPGTASPTSLL